MRWRILAAALSFVAISGAVAVASAAGTHAGPKAYALFGTNVVVLPDQLRDGDRVVVTSVTGADVYSTTVRGGAVRLTNLKLMDGVYFMSVVRRGAVISLVKVPVRPIPL